MDGDAAGVKRLNVKAVVPLKYLSNFFRSLEMPLINCKIKLNLTWEKNVRYQLVLVKHYLLLIMQKCTFRLLLCQKKIIKILFNNKIKDFKDFKDSRGDNNQPTRNGQRKYYLPRIDLNKYNVIIDERNFYENPIESDIERYRELKKVMIAKGEHYTTGSLLDFNYFNKHYKLVAVDLSKQKELDADSRAIQQIEFKYMIRTDSTIYWVLEKSKETILEFYKGTVKVY